MRDLYEIIRLAQTSKTQRIGWFIAFFPDTVCIPASMTRWGWQALISCAHPCSGGTQNLPANPKPVHAVWSEQAVFHS